MNERKIVLFGGSGFVGSVIANRLAGNGDQVNIITRDRERARHLWPLPKARVIETDISSAAKIAALIDKADVVFNLSGILNEKKDNGAGFRAVHLDLTQNILDACAKTKMPRYIHMSALNADPFAPSYYLRSKGEAENLVLKAHTQTLATTVFRPSVIFGNADTLFNRFANLLRISPIFFPLACAKTRLQPVFVGDVARALIMSIDHKESFGQSYELGGPEIVSLLELVEYTNQLCGTNRVIVPLGGVLSKIQANVCEYIPGKPFSRDNLRSSSEDSVCTKSNALDTFGIKPTPFDAVVPSYLPGYLKGAERARYDRMRSAAKRDR